MFLRLLSLCLIILNLLVNLAFIFFIIKVILSYFLLKNIIFIKAWLLGLISFNKDILIAFF
jgi:hypothetical protein